jgi:hypothetical protein
VNFQLADEPVWNYPDMLNIVDRDYLKFFQYYLANLGFDLSFFGASSWDQIHPIKASEAAITPNAPIEKRHLFFWTMHFAKSASNGMKMARDELKHAFNQNNMDIYVNWGNVMNSSLWYACNFNPLNPHSDPDSAIGYMDWFVSGRSNAHTLWTEDFGRQDREAQLWSSYADHLRSAAISGQGNNGNSSPPPHPGEPTSFGGYIHGDRNFLGAHPAGASYKAHSLIGHGAKTITFYSFGPDPGSDAWSNLSQVYKPIADAMRLIGRAENLLYRGRRERGKVAILIPGISNLWDKCNLFKLYQNEIRFIHYALIHSGFTVDFVDDYDIANGKLKQRKYTTLYCTGPNLSTDVVVQTSSTTNIRASAQEQIISWVHDDGGVFVVTPGAAVADEYNTQTSTTGTSNTELDEKVLGLNPKRKEVRDGKGWPNPLVKSVTTIFNPLFGNESVDISDPVVELEPTTATNIASFSDGEPAITINDYGTGHGIAYAFFPGYQYELSATWDYPRDVALGEPSLDSRLPYGWGNTYRAMVVGPAKIANTPKPVELDHELVEACRLDSAEGIAIILLNWNSTPRLELDKPINNLKVSLKTNISNADIKSAQGARVSSIQNNRGVLEFTLDKLMYVDILTIQENRS